MTTSQLNRTKRNTLERNVARRNRPKRNTARTSAHKRFDFEALEQRILLSASDPAAPLVDGGGAESDTQISVDVTQAEVEAMAAAAQQRWIDAGITADQLAALDSVNYAVADLGGNRIGSTEGYSITIDDNAAGNAWFVDATPADEAEFTAVLGYQDVYDEATGDLLSSNEVIVGFEANPATTASGGIDLLSVVLHEQGHILGLDDVDYALGNVMEGVFAPGERSLPASGQADGAVAGSLEGVHFAVGPYYWDADGTTAGFGTASGTWTNPTPGGTTGWSTDSTGASTIGSVTTALDSDVFFGFGANGLGSGTVTLSGTVQVNELDFGKNSGPITLDGGTIDMGGGTDLIRAESGGGTASNSHTINSDITKSSGTLRIGTQNTTNERYILNGELSGGFGLDGRIRNGSGVVTLNGLNTFTGNVGLVTGQYNVNTLADSGTASSLGAGNTITMGGGGGQQPRLVYTGTAATSTDRTLRVNANGTVGIIAQDGAVDFTGSVFALNGARKLALTGTADTGTNTVSGDMSDGTGTLRVEVQNFGATGVTGEAANWIFSGANTYTGTTLVFDNSTLQLGDGGTTGSLSTSSGITVSDGSTFIVNQSDTVSQGTDFSDILNGDGDVTMAGSGILELKIKGGYAGSTTVDSGTLRLVNTADLAGMTSDDFFINNGSTLEIQSSVGGANRSTLLNDSIFTFDSIGGGNIDFVSGNHLAQTGSSGNARFVTTGGAQNTITTSGGYINPQGNGNHVRFDVADGTDDVDLDVSVRISHGTWRKDGAGTLSITNTSSTVGAGGAININDGTFEIGGSGQIRSTGQAGGSGIVTTTINNEGIFKHNTTANQTLSGAISGTGALVKDNTGTLFLIGLNTYAGDTIVDGGLLEIGANQAVANGDIIVNDGGTYSVNSNAFNAFFGAVGSITINEGGTVSTDSASNNAHNLVDPLFINGGTLTSSGGAWGEGNWIFNDDVNVGGTSLSTISGLQVGSKGGGGTYNVADSVAGAGTDLLVTAQMVDASGGSFVTKTGAGTMELAADNTYTGITTIDGGTLALSGTGDIDQSSEIAIAGGASFDVTGRTGGAYTYGNDVTGDGTVVGELTSTGTISAGANSGSDVGTLTFNGDTTASGSVEIDITGSGTNDLLDVNGIVTLGGTLDIDLGGYTPAVGETFTIIDNDGVDAVSGTFSNADPLTIVDLDGTDFVVLYNGGDGNDVVLVAVEAGEIYVDDDFTPTAGLVIADADAGTTGDQGAVYGVNAFNNIADALTAEATSGATVIINDGTYNEAVSLDGTETVEITGPDAAGTVTIDSVDAVAGTSIVLEGSSSLVIGDGTDTTIGSVISGTGSLTKTGSGTVTLNSTVANTYSGGTTIEEGVLSLGTGGGSDTSHQDALGSGAVTVNSGGELRLWIKNNGSYTIDNAFTLDGGVIHNEDGLYDLTGAMTLDAAGGTLSAKWNNKPLTVSGVISGSGSLTVDQLHGGNGAIVILTNQNTYTGTTDINAGVLEFQSTSGFRSYVGDDININNGSTLQFRNNGGFGYVLDAADTINFDSNGGGLLNVVPGINFVVRGSTITTAGGATNTIQGSFNMDSGDVIFDVAPGTDPVDLTVSAVLSNSQGIVKQGDGTMQLTANNTYTGGTTVNDGELWLDGGQNTLASNSPLTIDGATSIVRLGPTVNGNNIFGSGPLTIQNGGTLTDDTSVGTVHSINNGLTFTNGGTLTSGGTGFNGSFGNYFINSSISVTGNAPATISADAFSMPTFGHTITVDDVTGDANTDLTISSVIQNWGANQSQLTKEGAGTLTLTGKSTFTGGTTVNDGVLELAGGSNTLAPFNSNNITIDGATVRLTGSANNIINNNTVTIQNGGVLTDDTSGPNVHSLDDVTFINGGTLTSAGAPPNGTFGNYFFNGDIFVTGNAPATISADNISLNGAARFIDVDDVTGDASTDLTISSVIQNWGANTVQVTKEGAGTLELTGTNTYTGTTTVNEGTLEIADTGTLGAGSYAGAITIAPDATLAYTSSASQSFDSINTDGTLLVDAGTGTLTLSASNTNQVDILDIRSGTLNSPRLTVVNQFTMTGGEFNQTAQRVRLVDPTGFADSSMTGGTANMRFFEFFSGTGVFNLDGGDMTMSDNAGLLMNRSGSSGTFNLNGGTLTLKKISEQSATGTTTFNFNGGTLIAGADNVNFMSGLDAANVQSGGAIIDTNGFDITIAQDLLDGGGDLQKFGTGTLTLAGDNTYSGSTTVHVDTLLLNGTHTGAGPYTVALGATLGGTGSTDGTVISAGTVSPGDGGIGTLSTGSLNLANGDYSVELGSGAADQTNVTGSVVLGGTLSAFGSPVEANGTALVIIDNDGTDAVSGTFAGLTEGDTVMVNGINYFITYVYNADTNTLDTGNDVALIDNTPPTAGDDVYPVTEDTPLSVVAPGVLANDTDPEAPPQTLTVSRVQGTGGDVAVTAAGVTVATTKGSLEIYEDGSFTYTPDADVNGTDNVTLYWATDGIEESASATVTFNIAAVDDANDDAFSTNEDNPVSDDVSTNDTYAGAVTYVINNDASNGIVSDDGNGAFTYTPSADFNGTDSFTYDATDVNGTTETQTVTITVNSVDDANDDNFSTDEDNPVSDDVSTNDTYSGAVTYVINNNASGGTVSDDGNGLFTYNPNGAFEYLAAGESTTDSFTYDATDVNATTETQTVTITIDGVNDAPVMPADTGVNVAENTTPVGTFAGTDVDNSDTLTYTLSGTDATLFNINSSTGEVSFITAPDFEFPSDAGGDNVYDITVTATDDSASGSLSDSQNVAVTVTNEDEYTTFVTVDGSGNLVITDVNADNTDDNLTLTIDGVTNEYVITDPGNLIGTDSGTGNDTNEVRVAIASVTGTNITFDTLGGDDTITVDNLDASGKRLFIFSGDGADTIDVNGGTVERLIAEGGGTAGETDTITVDGLTATNLMALRGISGPDTISVGTDAAVVVNTNVTIEGNAEDDGITVTNLTAGTLTIDGVGGTDVVNIGDVETTGMFPGTVTVTAETINLTGDVTSVTDQIYTANVVNVTTNATLSAEDVFLPGDVNLNANELTVNVTGTDSAIDGVISGTGGRLNKLGAGTLTLTNSNTYTGGTSIGDNTTATEGGSLVITNSDALGTGQLRYEQGGTLVLGADGLVVDNSFFVSNWGGSTRFVELDLAGANSGELTGNIDLRYSAANGFVTDVGDLDTLTLSGNISTGAGGGAGITKEGDGTLILSGNNTYLGNTTINDGVLQMGSNTALGSTAQGTIVNDGGALDTAGFDPSNGENFTINGTGTDGAGGTGALYSTSAGTVFGNTTTITLGSDAEIGGGGFRIDNFGTIDGGGFDLTKVGSENWWNWGNASNIGTLTVDSGGFLGVGSDSLADAANTVHVLDGATFMTWGTGHTFTSDWIFEDGSKFLNYWNAGNASTHEILGNVTLNGEVEFGANSNPGVNRVTTVSGDISGTGSISKTGNHTLVLSGDNTYDGGTTIKNGTVVFTNEDAFGTGTITMGTSNFDQALEFGADGLDLSNDMFIQNSIGKKTIRLDLDGATTGTLSGNVFVREANVDPEGLDFDIGTDDTLTVSGNITADTIAGTAEVTKTGAGTLVLSGTNTYKGITTISEGTLLLNGTHSAFGTATTGAYTVASGATLGGTGSTDGAVTVNGTLSPGDPTSGTADLGTGDLDLNGTLEIGLLSQAGAGTGHDLVTVTGDVDLSGTLDVTALGGFSAGLAQTYTIIDNDGTADAVTGTFSGLAEGASVGNFGGQDFFISYVGGDGNDVILFTSAIVEFDMTTNGADENSTADTPELRVTGYVATAQTIDVNVTGGTADEGPTTPDDFTNTASVTIDPGTYNGTTGPAINLTINGDTIVEADETIEFTLGTTSSALSIGDADGVGGTENTNTYTIGNDDSAEVTIDATDDAATEPGGTGNDGQFTVSISNASDIDTTVSYTVTGDANTGTVGNNDYTALSGTVTILAGETSATIDVAVLDDSVLEDNETVIVTLDSVTAGYTTDITIGAANSDTVTISDDDTAEVTIAANDAAASEPADDGQFTVSISNVSDTDTTVSYTVTGDANTGTVGSSDYTALSGTVTILAGETTATIDVDVLDDSVLEDNETVIVTLDSVTAGYTTDITIGAADEATVTISDDDSATVSIANANDGTEGGADGKFTVSITDVSDTDTVVTYQVLASSTASDGGVDYTTLSGTVTILAGNLTADIDVLVNNDFEVESAETVDVQLTAIANGDADITLDTTPGADTATVTILDNDLENTVVVDDGTIYISGSNDLGGEGGEGDKIDVKLGGEGTAEKPFFYEITIENPDKAVDTDGDGVGDGGEGGKTTFIVDANYPGVGDINDITRIVVYGLDGNDEIKIDSNVDAQAWLFGGNGDDKLRGGSGDDILVGGDGDDAMKGADGRDIAIGGLGADKIEGEAHDDILIGGESPIDNNLVALGEILSLWTVDDRNGDGLTGGEGEAGDDEDAAVDAELRALDILNGGYFDNMNLSDGSRDELKGGKGADWFLADTSELGDEDKIGSFKDIDFFGLDDTSWFEQDKDDLLVV